MTIHAHDFAPLNLRLDLRERRAVVDELTHLAALFACVIELKHPHICLAAIDAGRATKLLEDVLADVGGSLTLRRRYLPHVKRATPAKVLAITVPTPALVAIAGAVEARKRQCLLASSALL